MMKNSSAVKRSVLLNGHKTSISLENTFWDCLKEIAKERSLTTQALVANRQ
jgi:predicted DNA-binding ribbon-helix-helix protein